ncbi:MAG: hypothetical protein [Olavius algarvensis Gamma 3 endosymbiont]|nr:MAG: hypothetical protein [Olavius algarvensis Gamma 3 endosymbiont]
MKNEDKHKIAFCVCRALLSQDDLCRASLSERFYQAPAGGEAGSSPPAVVTFGGAYAVPAYLGQDVVGHPGSLDWRVIRLPLLVTLQLFKFHWGITRVLALASIGGILLAINPATI